MTKYECILDHRTLTVGKEYIEYFPNPHQFNAWVEDDTGEVKSFPRKQFFITKESGDEL